MLWKILKQGLKRERRARAGGGARGGARAAEDLSNGDGDEGHDAEGAEGAREGDELIGLHGVQPRDEKRLVAELGEDDERERLQEPGRQHRR
jgi:hypothetical protein